MVWDILFKKKLAVKIPPTFNVSTMYGVIAEVFDENLDARASRVVFDFSSLDFIEPVGVVILSNIFESLKKSKGRFQVPSANNAA